MTAAVRVVDCSPAAHAEPVRAILNHAIRHTTDRYEYEPRSTADVRAWFARRTAAGDPVLGALDAAGRLLGFASYALFRELPAWRHTVELSIYVAADARGRGVGGALLTRLLARARDQGHHALIAAIDAENRGSIAFHRRHGFVHIGTMREVGRKFGRWLDCAWYQRLLASGSE